MFCLIKAILTWVILLIVGTNLVGFVARGVFWSSPPVDAPTNRVREVLAQESRRMHATNVAMTLLFLVLTVAYFFALYHFWNIGLAVSAGLVMVSRLPDLLWEIRTGKKVSKASMPKGTAYIVATVLMWLALPLTWYSLCKWTP